MYYVDVLKKDSLKVYAWMVGLPLIVLAFCIFDTLTTALFLHVGFYTINVWTKAYAEMKKSKKHPYKHYKDEYCEETL